MTGGLFFRAEKTADTAVSAEPASFGGKNLSRLGAAFDWRNNDGRGDASLACVAKKAETG
jgi:hypothetical protein